MVQPSGGRALSRRKPPMNRFSATDKLLEINYAMGRMTGIAREDAARPRASWVAGGLDAAEGDAPDHVRAAV